MVDTSAWIEYFRRGEGAMVELLRAAIDADAVVCCGVVLTEMLRGAFDAMERAALGRVFDALPYVEATREDWEAAGDLLAQHRGRKIPVLDGLIAQLCLRHDLALLSADKHFDLFKKLRRLPVRTV